MNASGFHELPRVGMVSESVRLLTGAITRDIHIASVPALGAGLGFNVSYQSQDSTFGPLGHLWRHSYESKLVIGGPLVTFVDSDGQEYDFIPDGSGGWKLDISTSIYQAMELTNPTGSLWEVKITPSEFVWRWSAIPARRDALSRWKISVAT